jgi:hypothetical protein
MDTSERFTLTVVVSVLSSSPAPSAGEPFAATINIARKDLTEDGI